MSNNYMYKQNSVDLHTRLLICYVLADSHNSGPWTTESRQIPIDRPVSALPMN